MLVKHLISVAALAAFTPLGTSVALGSITISTVPVGNPGNVASSTGFGTVGYAFNIGTYEVTAGQYTAFLNAVARTDPNNLYNSSQASTTFGSGISRVVVSGGFTYSVDAAFVNRPVNYVSFWDAARFANWLHNGQPAGAQSAATTEDGAYTLTTGGIAANNAPRNVSAQWAVASENEWCKAAYYKGGSASAGYWQYPTRDNTVPGSNLADPSGNNANYVTGSGPFPIQDPYPTTMVGEFQNSAGPYGTFDQGGNVYEWTEGVFGGSARVIRGGSFDTDGFSLRIESRPFSDPTGENYEIGFRVVQIPASASGSLLAIGGIAALVRRRGVGR